MFLLLLFFLKLAEIFNSMHKILITLFIVLVHVGFTQERKIEKRVLSNFKEGKLDVALAELEALREKYSEYSFYHYWIGYIYFKKISEIKKINENINITHAEQLISIANKYLNKASELINQDQLNINKDEFDILFPGCPVTLYKDDRKYTNYNHSVNDEFQKMIYHLDTLKENLTINKQVSKCLNEETDLTFFIKKNRLRVKDNASLNELNGEINKNTFDKIIKTRNNQKLKELQKETDDSKWISYIKNFRDAEYISIVPELENMINNYYFESLNKIIKASKNDFAKLINYKAMDEANKLSLTNNPENYLNRIYGISNFSKNFVQQRILNCQTLIELSSSFLKEFENRKKTFESTTYKEYLTDNFENNTNNWYLITNENTTTKIENGKLIFEHKTSGDYINYTGNKLPLKNDAFSMSMSVKWVDGIENNSYGILWGVNGLNSFYSFGISANGSYSYSINNNGNQSTIVASKNSEFINKRSTNILSVKSNGAKLEFYINYHKVYESNFENFFGGQIGLRVIGKQTIEYDDLSIGYTPYIEPMVAVTEVDNNEEYNETFSSPEVEIQPIRSGYGPKIKDIDGNTYKTVYIGTQHWMAENLKTSKFNDGTKIVNITNYNQWENANISAWCYYDNKPVNNTIYGKLYNLYTVIPKMNGNKNICPSGWRVPNNADWQLLIDYLGGESVAGCKLKEAGYKHWKNNDFRYNKNYTATNSSLFTALPGGMRFAEYSGSFDNIDKVGAWWSSSEDRSNFSLLDNACWTSLSRYNYERNGYSIRCIKEEEIKEVHSCGH
jgi:uncharacterized protein (TIGR02145 family)